MLNEKCIALLLMAGSGGRFGHPLPKQFHRIANKKIYLHTLERLLQSKLFHEILLVCHPEHITEVHTDLLAYPDAPLRIVTGGATRQRSSYLGLMACPPDTSIVLIHDAARPFVTERILQDNIQAAHTHPAVCTCIPSTDTLLYAPRKDCIEAIFPRSHFLRAQTPQSFHYPLLRKAHEMTAHTNASDDCTLALEQGATIHIVLGDERNIKITTPLDLLLAEQLFP